MNWNVSKEDSEHIRVIMNRVMDFLNQMPEEFRERVGDSMSIEMDITACHCNDFPLDLEGLRLADEVDLVHDVFGIVQHIDRDTGKLQNCFVPRYAGQIVSKDL